MSKNEGKLTRWKIFLMYWDKDNSMKRGTRHISTSIQVANIPLRQRDGIFGVNPRVVEVITVLIISNHWLW